MTTPDRKHARTAPGFLLALALGLAIALGGFAWLDRGEAQAANAGWLDAAPVAGAEACSTHGYYNAGGYAGEIVVVTGVTTTYPTVYPYMYPYYGYPFAGYPVVTVQTGVVNTPYLPVYGEPYTAPTHVNYACNAFSNCTPVANAGAVVCPGNPAAITLNASLTSATCGSATNIDAKVVGPTGMIVADGTPVLFSTTLGMVPGETSTDDGIASVSLVFPPKTTGVATVNVTAGTAKATATINVTC
jgi:hypothetical protein